MQQRIEWFREARYGLFIHYGVYALPGRGEWVLNRERIPMDEYKRLADRFTAGALDFDALMERAKRVWGMKYAVLTCKHHDGFCLYDSDLTDFTAPKTRCGRDLVREFVEACRKHGLRIALYHTLNEWTTSPNAVDALERPDECYQPFIDFVHGQIREIMTKYGPVDTMWYDGWWPFDGKGWQAERLNAMVRELQPGILVNGRCGIPGDFDTPENRISASAEGRPWEACMTLNDNWGYHRGDHSWKSPREVCEMLRQCAAAQGNLLLNIGPKGDGSIPEESVRVLDKVGGWLTRNEEAVFGTERFVPSLHGRDGARADFNTSGRFTARSDAFYWHVRHWPGPTLTLAGVETPVTEVRELGAPEPYPFEQDGDRVIVTTPHEERRLETPAVLRFRTEGRPSLYLCGGYRTPNVPHCRYDPVESDMEEEP